MAPSIKITRIGMTKIFILSGICSGFFCGGLAFGNPTVMIPQLKHEDSAMHVNMNMATWLMSIQGVSSLVGLLYIPALMQAKGRRIAFMINSLPVVISWIIIYFATTVTELMIGGFLHGLAMGGILTLCIISVAEYSDPKYRGVFMIVKTASLYWGIWIANALGTVFYWRTAVLYMMVPSIYAFISPLAWPESPTWLASKGYFDRCTKSYHWLRGNGVEVETELRKLIEAQTKLHCEEANRKISFFPRLREKMTSENFYKPMLLSMVLFLQFYACGKLVHASYALIIIKEITSSESTAFTGMLIIDGVTVFFMYLGCFLAHKLKRRVLLFSSCIAAIVVLVILSIYLYLIRYKIISEVTIVSLLLLVMYSIAISSGPTTLPTSLYGEIMPVEHKSLCTMIVGAYSGLLQSFFLKTSPYMFKSIGLPSSFLVFAAITAICLIILYKYLPETKDKTLQEIEDSFSTKNVKNSDNNNQCELQSMLKCKN